MKRKMINHFVFWLSLVMAFSLHGQSSVEIDRDTVYFDGEKGGVITVHNKVAVISLEKKVYKNLYGQLLKNMAGSMAKRVKINVDNYVFKDSVKVLNERVWYGKSEIGVLEELEEGFVVQVSDLGVDSSLIPYVRREVVAYLHDLFGAQNHIDVKVDFTEEYYRQTARLKAEKRSEERRAEMLRKRTDSTRYISWVKRKLKSSNQRGIVGVYTNFGKGLKYNYTVAVLQGEEEGGGQQGWVLESSNPYISPIWQPLFTLKKTAAKNKYLLHFGFGEKAKLATFENNTIKLNTIGFIKVNKSEYVGHNTQEQERGVISTGSGFFLGENGNYVVTNKHVVDLSKNQLYCINIRYKNGDSILIRRFRIVAQDEKADLAILKMVEDEDLRGDTLVLNLNLKPRLGMEIESYGFPSPGVLGLDVQRNVGTVTRSYGSNKRLAFIQTDLPAWYGYSGGAAYGSSGNLVGVITSMVYDGKEKIENVTYLSAAENLLPLLKKSDIAYEISNVEDNSGTKIEDLAKRAVLIAIEQCKK